MVKETCRAFLWSLVSVITRPSGLHLQTRKWESNMNYRLSRSYRQKQFPIDSKITRARWSIRQISVFSLFHRASVECFSYQCCIMLRSNSCQSPDTQGKKWKSFLGYNPSQTRGKQGAKSSAFKWTKKKNLILTFGRKTKHCFKVDLKSKWYQITFFSSATIITM